MLLRIGNNQKHMFSPYPKRKHEKKECYFKEGLKLMDNIQTIYEKNWELKDSSLAQILICGVDLFKHKRS